MKVGFLPPALRELEDAFAWYQDQRYGLGNDFLDEVDEGVRRIVSWPEIHSLFGEHQRRCLIRRFPFGLIYERDGDSIVVVAVAHLHRKPFYWSGRK